MLTAKPIQNTVCCDFWGRKTDSINDTHYIKSTPNKLTDTALLTPCTKMPLIKDKWISSFWRFLLHYIFGRHGKYILTSLIITEIKKFKIILVSDYLSQFFAVISFVHFQIIPAIMTHTRMHAHTPTSVFTTLSQNVKLTIHRKAGHFSNTKTWVKFCLRPKSPEHLFNRELFGNILNKRQKVARK